MKISEFLSPSNVVVDVAAADKQKLLQNVGGKAGAIVDVLPERILAELRKREELGSTGVGGGVALPHARFHQISKPTGLLLRLRKAIDFDAVDGEPVDIVFLLLFRKRATTSRSARCLDRPQAAKPGRHDGFARGTRRPGDVPDARRGVTRSGCGSRSRRETAELGCEC